MSQIRRIWADSPSTGAEDVLLGIHDGLGWLRSLRRSKVLFAGKKCGGGKRERRAELMEVMQERKMGGRRVVVLDSLW